MKRPQIATYFMDLAILLEGRMVLSSAADLLAEESANHNEALVVARAVKSGFSLSAALAEAFAPLPDWIGAAVSATERVGEPEKGLRLAAAQLLEEKKWREEFSRSLSYPLVLLGTTVLFGIIMARTVLPSLAAMSSDLGGSVPVTTEIAIGVGRALGSFWAFGVWAAVVALLLWVAWGGSTARDLAARAPILRSIIRLVETWRFFSIATVLLRSAVPLHLVVESSSRVISTPSWRKEAQELARGVRGGKSIGVAARNVSWFPIRVSRVLSISTGHGALIDGAESLTSWAEYERVRLLATWAKWLPVGFLAVAALLIGFLAQAVLMPALSVDIAP